MFSIKLWELSISNKYLKILLLGITVLVTVYLIPQ